jgi:phospholipid/cholesterol/gamma-HCH transport system substrate-binding protein
VETQARYLWVGAFTLAVITAGFAFVYWLYSGGGFQDRTVYEIRFDNPVSGLLVGSAVLFNGIRVGEVTDLRLSSEQPKQVVARVGIDPATPVRADTSVSMDFQGLTGAPVILLTGGSPVAAPVASTPNAAAPTLVAEADSGQSMTQAARTTLKRIDTVLAENSEPLRDVIANFKTFSEALARNSDRIDGVVAGLERMTGGAAGKAKIPTYSLKAVETFPKLPQSKLGQLAVPEPAALMSLSSDKILIALDDTDGTTIDDAQWSDNLPVLVQAKLIESLENSHYFQSVGRPVDGYEADRQLITEVRAFRIVAAPTASANVAISAKILSNGRIIATHVFDVSVPIAAVDPSGAVAGLNQAFAEILKQLVAWVAATPAEPPLPASERAQ